MVGRQIARYRIVEQLGSGGMSVVYKGVDTALDREVAVKVLHPHLASKEESRRRFSREAKAVAKLHHPNILEIFDFSGDDAPESYIVTEYIRGSTLRLFAERTAFHPPEIAAMAIHELASALEHAHSQGIIHRDLKPENVMIREDGVLKLMDFGIAKVIDREERMTMTGALVGSPAHMAPEIIEGEEAGRESDVFSLGTILYWLCCRKLPFQGNNTTQTLKLILDGKYPDPRIDNAAVSDELAAIIARCLARDPLDRYQDAGALREALAAALREAGVDRPGEELAAFFADPEGFRGQFHRRLVERLLAEAERCARSAQKNHARALDCLNRVLALEPTNARARELIEWTRKRKRRQKQLATAGGAVAGLVVLAAIGWGGLSAWQQYRVEQERLAAAHAAEAARPDPKPAPTPLPPQPVLSPPTPTAPPPETPPATVTVTNPAPPTPAPGPAVKPAETTRPKDRPKPTGPTASAPKLASATVAAKQNVSIKYLPQHYARIFVDGELVNPSRPNFDGQLAVGKHKVRIESPSCEPWEQMVDVTGEGAGPSVVARLVRKPALVTIETAQRDASVMVGGYLRGSAADSEKDPFPVPLPEGALRGTVAIRVYKPGFKDRVLNETFVAGETRRLKVDLEKP